MIRYLLDEHLRGPLWTAIVTQNAQSSFPIEVTRVGDPSDLPLSTLDPDILIWTEVHQRILISRDGSTLPIHLNDHLAVGRHCPGIFLIRRRCTIPAVLDFMALAAYASTAEDWTDHVEYIG
jgi:hypothetical protein